jgi:L-amino acid N-acyltransferase YncA
MNIEIRNFEEKDWPVVVDIYRLGLLTRNATFETEALDFDNWIKKFYLQLLWVAERQNNIVGWAGLMPVSARHVYRGVVEVSIYIHSEN